jgi:hypothetical protein
MGGERLNTWVATLSLDVFGSEGGSTRGEGEVAGAADGATSTGGVDIGAEFRADFGVWTGAGTDVGALGPTAAR